MGKFGCFSLLIIINTIIIVVLSLPAIIKKRTSGILRIGSLIFISLMCLFYLWVNREEEPFYLYKHSNYSKYSILATFFFYLGPMILYTHKLYHSYLRQKVRNLTQYVAAHIKNCIRNNILLEVLLLPAIEEVIFRAFYCNFMLSNGFNLYETMIGSSLLYGISRIYYYFTSPAAFTNKQRGLIGRTIKFVLYSTLFGIAASYAYCKSKSFHASFIMNSIYTYIDNPLCLGVWNSARKSIMQIFIRLALAFGLIYTLSVIAMFYTSDKL